VKRLRRSSTATANPRVAVDPPVPPRALTLGVIGVGPSAVGLPWSFEWLVRGEDRWHRPRQDRSVEQRYVDHLAIVETTVRVPGGEVVARSYAVPSSAGGAWVILEFENASASPTAVALGVRGGASIGTAQADLLTLDSRPALWWTRRPSRYCVLDASENISSDDAYEAIIGSLVADDTVDLAPGVQMLQRDDDAPFGCGFVWPLPHRATLRLAVPVGAVERSQPVLPPFDAVLRGWTSQVDALARIDLPDARFGAAWTAATRSLLVHVGIEGLEAPVGREHRWSVAEEAAAVRGLATIGAVGDSARTLALRLDPALAANWMDRTGRPERSDPATAAGVIVAFADTVLLAPDAGLEPILHTNALAEVLSFVRPVHRANDASAEEALDRLGAALRRLQVGELDLGRARADSTSAHPDTPDALAMALRRVRDLGERMVWPGPGTGDDPAGAAATLAALRALVVHEPAPGGPLAVLELLPDVPPDWYGRPLEIHDLPTAYGRLSFAVRWHGERPALLWQFDHAAGVSGVTLRCPGLDPSWSSGEARGEVLLERPPLAEERLAPAPTVSPAPGDGQGLSFS
jgi:hypothetical protein